jgi:Arc/MetJ family transcription regulator
MKTISITIDELLHKEALRLAGQMVDPLSFSAYVRHLIRADIRREKEALDKIVRDKQ